MQKQYLNVAIFAAILNLSLLGTTAIAHVGHDSEFQGDASQVMKSVVVDSAMASTLGIKTVPIEVKGPTIKVPVSSLVDANGQSLVYVQDGTNYTPIFVKSGATAGEFVELAEGNLKSGQMVVTQGATLLYSQAMRGGSPTAASSSASSSSQNAQSPTPQSGLHKHGDGPLHMDEPGLSKKAIVGAGFGSVAVLGAIAFGISKMRKSS
jgi:membrane fusion protein, cation efflux system